MNRTRFSIPTFVLRQWRWIRGLLQARSVAGQDVRSVFREIYGRHKWGRVDDGFFSGSGSLDINTRPYVAFVNQFMDEHGISDLVDLGCGDFRVGRQLALDGRHYIGADIVDELIQQNRQRYGAPNITFKSLNIITDELPCGNLCLIRQVFQHLSNGAISEILPKLKQYRYVLITDAQMKSPSKVNIDIPNFGGTRLDFGSNLLLEKAPFSVDLDVVLESPVAHRDDCRLRTILLAN